MSSAPPAGPLDSPTRHRRAGTSAPADVLVQTENMPGAVDEQHGSADCGACGSPAGERCARGCGEDDDEREGMTMEWEPKDDEEREAVDYRSNTYCEALSGQLACTRAVGHSG